MAQISRSLRGFLEPSKTIFLLCDVQEKFRPVMQHFKQVVQTSNKLICSAKVLNVPLLCTEQNPKSLGHTAPDIDISYASAVIAKTSFSMYNAVKDQIKTIGGNKAESIVIFGLEAHVCVEQSVMDFIKEGFDVHVVADATISRSQEDRLLAFQRMQNMGAIVTTSENVIFKLLKDCDRPEFKTIINFVKVKSPSTDLVSKI